MTYYVCSDRIDGKEQSYIQDVISELKAVGKQAESGGVGPNKESLRNSKSSEDTVVFLVGGGRAGATWASFVKSVEGKKDYAHTIVAYAGWTSNPHVSCEAARTETLIAEWDSGGFYQSWMPSYYEGHTIVTFCEKYSSVLSFCCSDESASDLGKKIANGTCGGGSSDEQGGSSASTIKDAIKEVISYWDGEAECRVENDTVYINKVPDPSKATLELKEGVNILADSVSITDVNPDTVNFLTVHWSGGSDIVKRDEALIARFGEKPLELDAVKRVTTTETEEEDDEESDTTGVPDETTTETEEPTETKTPTKTEEVPVETYEEALEFANIEWAKIRREDGHTIECSHIAGTEWKGGQWVKVNIPTFDEDCYMYSTKVNHSESDSGWESSVTLVDYPPSFGDPPEAEKETPDTETSVDETEEEIPTT